MRFEQCASGDYHNQRCDSVRVAVRIAATQHLPEHQNVPLSAVQRAIYFYVKRQPYCLEDGGIPLWFRNRHNDPTRVSQVGSQ